VVPIQFGWLFLSDREKRCMAGIPKATYTGKGQAGTSVITITTSQSAAVATNAMGSSLVSRSDLFWVVVVGSVIGWSLSFSCGGLSLVLFLTVSTVRVRRSEIVRRTGGSNSRRRRNQSTDRYGGWWTALDHPARFVPR
jgi:hypothetical protein